MTDVPSFRMVAIALGLLSVLVCLLFHSRFPLQYNHSPSGRFLSTKLRARIQEWSSFSAPVLPFWDPRQAHYYGHPVAVAKPPKSRSTGSLRIVGGSDVTEPHTFFGLLLTWSWQHYQWQYMGCAGTLISDRHVLTAAHCVYFRRRTQYDGFYLNAYQPFHRNGGEPFKFVHVKGYTVHPEYNPFRSMQHDVAVVTLSQPIQGYRPVELASRNTLKDSESITVLGFGQLSEDDTSWPHTLQSTTMPYYNSTTCNNWYHDYDVPEDMVCAGDLLGGNDACRGDSGGPMLHTSDRVRQLSVVSWGEGCGRAFRPGVYASVAYHFEWIQQVVCAVDGVVSESLCTAK